jgi:hypothetical protein
VKANELLEMAKDACVKFRASEMYRSDKEIEQLYSQ